MTEMYARIEKMEKALRAHANFWDFLVAHFFDGGGSLELDGVEFQERATRCGLLRKEPYDPKKHGPDGTGAAEPGDDWYVSTEIARAALGENDR